MSALCKKGEYQPRQTIQIATGCQFGVLVDQENAKFSYMCHPKTGDRMVTGDLMQNGDRAFQR